MNEDLMYNRIVTERLALFPLTAEGLSLLTTELPLFEKTFGVAYHGEEMDDEFMGFLKRLEGAVDNDPEHYLFLTLFLITLKENDHVIGSLSFKYPPRDGVTEVGYGLNSAYTGHGYMTEALSALLDFGRSLGVTTVRADTERDNIKSQAVLQRCGFVFLREDENLWWEKSLD